MVAMLRVLFGFVVVSSFRSLERAVWG